jgi:hypothetical protein
VEVTKRVEMKKGEIMSNYDDSWMAGESIPGVRFKLNDCVRIVAGRHAGAYGSVITLLNVAPEPRYLVELSSGVDIEVLQIELEAN